MNFILRTLFAANWKRREQQYKQIMDELKNLTAAITKLTVAIDDKLAQPAGVPAADVQAAADAVNAQTDRLAPPTA